MPERIATDVVAFRKRVFDPERIERVWNSVINRTLLSPIARDELLRWYCGRREYHRTAWTSRTASKCVDITSVIEAVPAIEIGRSQRSCWSCVRRWLPARSWWWVLQRCCGSGGTKGRPRKVLAPANTDTSRSSIELREIVSTRNQPIATQKRVNKSDLRDCRRNQESPSAESHNRPRH